VPFTVEEVWQAIAARVPTARPGPAVPDPAAAEVGGENVVVVGPSDAGRVHVRVGDKAAIVDVGARRGAPAARAVALVIADLASNELAPPSAPVVAFGRTLLVAPATRDEPAAHRPVRLTVGVGLSKGASSEEPPCYSIEGDVVGPSLGRLHFGAALGAAWIPRRDAPAPDGMSYRAVVARLLIAWRAGAFEALVGPFAAPYLLQGATDHSGVLAGATAIVRLSPTLTSSRRLRLVVAVRTDAYANRIHVRWTNQDSFATPRIDAAFDVGFAWDLGS
jgi:hypothetical protein